MNKKRKLLVDTSLSLFYKNGINSIGINEILKTAGVAKQTLYSHFESKEHLIIAALEQRHLNFIEWLQIKLKDVSSNEELITRLFKALDSWFVDSEPMLGDFRGCFFVNSSAEFSDASCDISLFCKMHKQKVREIISLHMPQEDPLLLDAMCIMKEGAIANAYVTGDSSSAIKCIQMLNHMRAN